MRIVVRRVGQDSAIGGPAAVADRVMAAGERFEVVRCLGAPSTRARGSPRSQLHGDSALLDVFVDADGCPVKEVVYRVARRYGLKVFLVANSRMRAPEGDWLAQVTVGPEFNAADDWIAEHAGVDDIVVTGDIPLASRCVHQGAKVLGLKGRPFTEDNIGNVLATRDLLAELREQGAKTRGPDPFAKQDRSRFLQQLDEMIQEFRRRA